MSRLTDLIARAKSQDAQLGEDLEREFRALSGRRAFGINFERHQPEAVELPKRPVRKGDKVRILPERGSTVKGDQRLWTVKGIANGLARLELTFGDPADREVPLDHLVVVAEFRDFIYPGLVSTGKVECGGDKPFHTVINAENYHALKALSYTHRGKIDAIYIDPPYNTGATDWKYNNDYVGEEDLYRHSKWLAFIERRLKLAVDLLNPENSVLIVTIDDKESSRLGVLLDQLFPEARIEMVTSVINPRGKYRRGEFARCEEYIFFLAFGRAQVLGEPDRDFSQGAAIGWRTLRRSDLTSARGTKKGGTSQFFPIYVDRDGAISDIGEPLTPDVPRNAAPTRADCVPVFPIRDDGTEMNWGLTPSTLRQLKEKGYVRVGRHTPEKPQIYEISYLTSGRIDDIESGKAVVTGFNSDGSVVAAYETHKIKMPISTWLRSAHNAEIHGTDLLKAMIGERGFPFPKSLYAVEDCLRLFISDKPEATVLDFFSGSGTTAHAVMRLNRQDGGRRQSISVTNNEVSAGEQERLRKQGYRPGDPEWERWGICDYITKVRIQAAVTGRRPDGALIDGDYQFHDVFPMSDGVEENAEFFTLTYETPIAVDHGKAFEKIAPLLWMRAGSRGARIETLPASGWAVSEAYGLLTDLDQAEPFYEAVSQAASLRVAFIVTNDNKRFEAVAQALEQSREGVEAVRLYESYLTNFRFASGGEA